MEKKKTPTKKERMAKALKANLAKRKERQKSLQDLIPEQIRESTGRNASISQACRAEVKI